jgi:hypothetical protein
MLNDAITSGPVSLPEAVAMVDTAYLGHIIAVVLGAQAAQPRSHRVDDRPFRSLDGRDREIPVPV